MKKAVSSTTTFDLEEELDETERGVALRMKPERIVYLFQQYSRTRRKSVLEGKLVNIIRVSKIRISSRSVMLKL